jgi:hypothetical protein
MALPHGRAARNGLSGMGSRLLEGLKVWPEELVGLIKLLWNDADLAYNGHIIRIAGPAWDDMDVQVFRNARSGSSAKIQADIKTARVEDPAQDALTGGREFEKIGTLGRRQVRERCHMPIRDHHEMAVVIRITIQHHKSRRAAPQKVILYVALLMRLVAKYAAGILVFVG